MTAIDVTNAKHYRWAELPAETLKGGLTRRLITGERMMIAHVHFKKGDDVPWHSHENEQITYILEGSTWTYSIRLDRTGWLARTPIFADESIR